jgi:hypothetical protein
VTNLFMPGETEDLSYRNIRDSAQPRAAQIREYCEALWRIYEPCADEHFLTEIRRDFIARFWEMYLAVTLRELGHQLTCPKPGPDVGIVWEGQRIWFEAVAPKPGDPASRDRVPDLVFGQVTSVPTEQMILRYLNAIQTKLTDQYPRWLRSGVIAEDDALVIAVNPRALGHDFLDGIPPRIVQAALPIGGPTVTLDGSSGTVLGEGYQRRVSIAKASGSQVPTGAFLHPRGLALSALLCSRVDAASGPTQLGGDFQLVPNPLARAQLPASFRLPGTYFPVVRDGDNLVVTLR